jgi:hypothetical protein
MKKNPHQQLTSLQRIPRAEVVLVANNAKKINVNRFQNFLKTRNLA